jgi:hypothetical protein
MKIFSRMTNITLRTGSALVLTLPLPYLSCFRNNVILAAAPFRHHLLFMATLQRSVHLTLPLLLHLHMLCGHHLLPLCVSPSLRMASLRSLALALTLAH